MKTCHSVSRKILLTVASSGLLFFSACSWSEGDDDWYAPKTTTIMKKGLIRVVPIPPLDGSSYPATTGTTADGKQITFANGVKHNAWFALELSGWGPTKKLTGYDVVLSISPGYCPRPPCGCMAGGVTTTNIPCPGGDPDCPKGSICTSAGNCKTAFHDENDSDFVFYGMGNTASIVPLHPEYSFEVMLDPGYAKSEIGTPLVGGYFVVFATDYCLDSTGFDIGVMSGTVPAFYLSDGSTMYPEVVGAILYSEGP